MLVQPHDPSEFAHSSVFHEVVGKAKTLNLGMEAMIVHPFEHSRTHAAHARTILDGDDMAEALTYRGEHLLIERLEEAQIVMRYA